MTVCVFPVVLTVRRPTRARVDVDVRSSVIRHPSSSRGCVRRHRCLHWCRPRTRRGRRDDEIEIEIEIEIDLDLDLDAWSTGRRRDRARVYECWFMTHHVSLTNGPQTNRRRLRANARRGRVNVTHRGRRAIVQRFDFFSHPRCRQTTMNPRKARRACNSCPECPESPKRRRECTNRRCVQNFFPSTAAHTAMDATSPMRIIQE